MVFGIIFMFLAIVGLISLVRPLMFGKTKFPEKKVKSYLRKYNLSFESYSGLKKEEYSKLNFSNDKNPTNSRLFYGVGHYELKVKDKNDAENTLFVKWYKSYGFPFTDKIYFLTDQQNQKYQKV